MTQSPNIAEPTGCDPYRQLSETQQQHVDRFAGSLAGCTRAAVAFSGGVDSSLVVALMVRTLGTDNVVAVLGVSPSLAETERHGAHALAGQIGIPVLEVETQEMAIPEYVANGADRCYFCKHELYSRSIEQVVRDAGADVFVNGDTADDVVRRDRPGKRAATELGVISPLARAGIGKKTVRELARALGVPVWDKPSSPCLASRIPRSVPVTITRLSEVERAEVRLSELGLRVLRVRHGGQTAFVELGASELAQASDVSLRARIVAELRTCGFTHVQIVAEPLVRD